uniref:Uncharacterized protein n=1 Tax=Tetranychus urticae TaxID=32264 RepID=T1L4X0_TETUR
MCLNEQLILKVFTGEETWKKAKGLKESEEKKKKVEMVKRKKQSLNWLPRKQGKGRNQDEPEKQSDANNETNEWQKV